MNKKGFTLIELLATLLLLGIIVGFTIYSLNGIFNSTKQKTEDVFVGTISDALDIYLTSSDAKRLIYNNACSNLLNKKTFGGVKVYWTTINFSDVINSEYKPITQDDLINPANEEVGCNLGNNITVNIYRDDNYVYYYMVDKDSFGCLKNSGVISNLPEGYICG